MIDRSFEVLLLKTAWHALQGATLTYQRQIVDLDEVAGNNKNNPLYQSATCWRDQTAEAEELMADIEERLFDLGERVN